LLFVVDFNGVFLVTLVIIVSLVAIFRLEL
jgi:hypothetical protein